MKSTTWVLEDAQFVLPEGTRAPVGGRVNFLRLPPEDGRETRLRVAYWRERDPGASAGTVLLLGGYAEFIEKYFETIDALLERGFGVLTFDWRGQGLSTRLLEADNFGFNRGYVDSFERHVADAQMLLAYMDRLVGDDRRLLLAHSMGGNLALRLLAANAGYFERAVLSAPMLGLIGIPTWFVGLMSSIYCGLGRETRYAWGSKPMDLDNPMNVVTGSDERFARTIRFLRAEPNLLTSGVTWGWLRAAAQSMRVAKRRALLSGLSLPLLVFSATQDRLVGRVGHRRLARRAPHVRHVVLEGAMHEPLTEVDAIRDQMWEEIDDFLGVVNQ